MSEIVDNLSSLSDENSSNHLIAVDSAISAVLTGSCHCGNASFTVPAGSMRFGFSSCHCSACRIIHAAPFVQWSGMNAEFSDDFVIKLADESIPLSIYQSSPICRRYFCSRCGTHVYIRYIGKEDNQPEWKGEVHFPTALLTAEGVQYLEQRIIATQKLRYVHVFYSDRSSCLGNLDTWAKAPKYGGETGLEALSEDA